MLDAEGIFGQVTKVNADTAEAILISDRRACDPGADRIAAACARSRSEPVIPASFRCPFVTVEADLQRRRPVACRPAWAACSRPVTRWHRCRRSNAAPARRLPRRGASHGATRPGSRGVARLVQARRHGGGPRIAAAHRERTATAPTTGAALLRPEHRQRRWQLRQAAAAPGNPPAADPGVGRMRQPTNFARRLLLLAEHRSGPRARHRAAARLARSRRGRTWRCSR